MRDPQVLRVVDVGAEPDTPGHLGFRAVEDVWSGRHDRLEGFAGLQVAEDLADDRPLALQRDRIQGDHASARGLHEAIGLRPGPLPQERLVERGKHLVGRDVLDPEPEHERVLPAVLRLALQPCSFESDRS